MMRSYTYAVVAAVCLAGPLPACAGSEPRPEDDVSAETTPEETAEQRTLRLHIDAFKHETAAALHTLADRLENIEEHVDREADHARHDAEVNSIKKRAAQLQTDLDRLAGNTGAEFERIRDQLKTELEELQKRVQAMSKHRAPEGDDDTDDPADTDANHEDED